MNGGIVFGIVVIIAIIIVIALTMILPLEGGASRKERELTRTQRNLAYETLTAIGKICEEYKEIDHPLASKLAPLISEFKEKEWELRK